ncbi:MAG: flagellar protein FliO/FliZ [Phenylobacterium sp.]
MKRFIIKSTALFMLWLPMLALATPKPSPGPTASNYLSVLISLFIVIGVMIVLAVFYKRMNLGFTGSQAIKVVTTLPVGAKERILVIEVNGQQHLLGVTPQQINHLITLDEPIEMDNMGPANLATSFQKILQGAKKSS